MDVWSQVWLHHKIQKKKKKKEKKNLEATVILKAGFLERESSPQDFIKQAFE